MISEADLKRTIEDYLQLGQNQGRWVFLRLNAGDFIVQTHNHFGGRWGMASRRRIKGCPRGTADLEVIKGRFMEDGKRFGRPLIYFLELKSSKGKQTKEQQEFQKLVEMQGCSYFIIRSLEELVELIK